MDRNLVLAMVLSLAVFSAWLAWEEHHRPPIGEAAAPLAVEGAETVPGPRPGSRDEGLAGSRVPERAAETASAPRATERSARDTRDVEPWKGVLESPLAVAEIDNRGATLSGWRIKTYFETADRERNVELIRGTQGDSRALLTPFEELGLGDLGDALYEVESRSGESISLVLRRAGITIRKIYSLNGESGYGLDLLIEIENGSDRGVSSSFAVAWPAETNALRDFSELALVAISEGTAERQPVATVGQPGFMSRIFGDAEAQEPEPWRSVEWAGIDLRYFAGVVSPLDSREAVARFVPLEKGRSGAVVLEQAPERIEAGGRLTRRYSTFLGPKEPALLRGLAGSLPLLIDDGYSWIAPLTRFFGWALHALHDFVPNYGLAIILITIIVRLGTWPIMARQMKSAERMRELMPRIKELQERYKDDRQKQSEETFKLYRETGVNPLGGCLPMILQLPVFIGLFYALQSSIDLRHAPFVWWIKDLSAPATLFTVPGIDLPIRLLPILMGASMYVQQKMMPQTGMDPAQARMMLIMMPGMMLVISYGFPAGLVLYWLVSNLLGIGHQLLVRRQMHAAK